MKKKHRILLAVFTIFSLSAEFATTSDPDPGHWWSGFHGFYLILGFVGCIAIIVISKALGKWFLQRKEDYYDAG